MDSSRITGSTEECSDSESGWTFYINSPTQEGEEVYDHSLDKDAHDSDDEKGNRSDDSMASDASSGPSQLPSRSSDVGDLRHREYEHQRKHVSGNKSHKQQAKERGERSAQGNREPKFNADSAGSHVKKGSKGRKTS